MDSPSAPSLTAVRRALPLAELSRSCARGIGFFRLTAQRRARYGSFGKAGSPGSGIPSARLPNGFSAFSAERSVKRQNGAAQRRRAVLLLLLATAAAAAAGQQQQRRPRQQQLRQESRLPPHQWQQQQQHAKTMKENPATFNFLRGPPKPRGEVTDTLALHTLDEPKQSVNLEVSTRCDAPHHARAEARRSRA